MADASLIDPEGHIIKFKDKMHRASYEQIAEFINQRNGLVSKANAVHGDKEALYDNLTETSDDPAIVKAREQRDEALETLAKLVGPKVEEVLASAESTVAEVENEVKELDTLLRAATSYFRKLYGDDATKQLPEQVRSRSLKVGGGRSGGKRIRGYNVITTFKGKTDEHENFTNAAKALGQDTSVLQAAFFEAIAPVDAAKDAPDTVEFDLEVSEVDGDGNETKVKSHIKAYRTAKESETEPEAPVTDE